MSEFDARADKSPARTDASHAQSTEPHDALTERTAFQRDCLWTIARHDSHKGTAIQDAIETYYGDRINHGRLYPNLDDLVEAGLLDKSERDGRTNEYTLTDRGHDALARCRQWTAVEVDQ